MTSTVQARPRANHDDAPKTHHRGKPARHGPRPGRAANRATPPRATHRPPHTARPMVVVPMLVPKRRLARRHSSELGAGRTIWSAARRQQHTLRTAPNAARVRGRFSELSSSFCIWLTPAAKPRRPDVHSQRSGSRNATRRRLQPLVRQRLPLFGVCVGHGRSIDPGFARSAQPIAHRAVAAPISKYLMPRRPGNRGERAAAAQTLMAPASSNNGDDASSQTKPCAAKGTGEGEW